MRFIELSSEEASRLGVLYKESPHHQVRERAHALLLSSKGHSRDTLAGMFSKAPDTISDWFNWYEQDRSWDLRDRAGRGRKPKLSGPLKKKSTSSWTGRCPEA